MRTEPQEMLNHFRSHQSAHLGYFLFGPFAPSTGLRPAPLAAPPQGWLEELGLLLIPPKLPVFLRWAQKHPAAFRLNSSAT